MTGQKRTHIAKTVGNIIGSAIMVLIALVVVLPVVTVIISSFKDGLRGYSDFFVWNPEMLKALLNSIIIAVCTSTGTVIISFTAAFVFAKLRFKGKNLLFYIYIIVMMMPFQVTLLPQYMAAKAIHTYDTQLGMILPGIFAPFSVFLLTQIMKTVPDDIIEAARLDTDSSVRILTRVIAPTMRPGIICAWVLCFTEQWNMVAEPLILMETESKYPLSVMLSKLTPGEAVAFAATTVFILLPLFLYGLFESEIIEGLEDYKL